YLHRPGSCTSRWNRLLLDPHAFGGPRDATPRHDEWPSPCSIVGPLMGVAAEMVPENRRDVDAEAQATFDRRAPGSTNLEDRRAPCAVRGTCGALGDSMQPSQRVVFRSA